MAEVVLYGFFAVGIVGIVWMVIDVIHTIRKPRSWNDSDGWPSE